MCRIDSGAHQINVISETANKDVLTGILNRTGFVNKLEKSLSEGNNGTFFLLDLDNFKSVNDTLGHQAGDRVLIDCAHTMQNIFLCNNLSLTVEEGGQSVKIGCSIGIVTNVAKNSFSEIYQNADQALYAAKSKGKGRYSIS